MKRTSLIIAAIVFALIFSTPGAWAKGPEENLAAKVAALEATVANLQNQMASLLTFITIEMDELNGLKGPHVIFTGANVHIRSGSGSTNDGGTLYGWGNLIIGYNEDDATTVLRTGSHNLVVGTRHTYSNFGGFVAGRENAVTGAYSSVSGGYNNTASGNHSSVSGGESNTASGHYSSVSGGHNNTASHFNSSVSGGWNNTASGYYSSVSGGVSNTASGQYSSVSGGRNNTASTADSYAPFP